MKKTLLKRSRMKINSLLMLVLIIALCIPILSSGERHFKRIENFPSGQQTKTLVGSFLSGIKDHRYLKYTFDAPYERVWMAIKRVSQKFDKIGGRPVIAVDEANGRIQNGRITQDAMIGLGSGAFLDQFVIEANNLDSKTKVTISRKVVKRSYTGKRSWDTHYSNGKIERWIMTQIEDEIKSTSAALDTLNTIQSKKTNGDSKILLGKYINNDNKAEFIELKPDRSFYIQERGIGLTGNYNISGNLITFSLPNGIAFRAILNDNNIIDDDGKKWNKSEVTPSTSKLSEMLTNDDIIRMVKAKVPDSVIIAKIHSSDSKFEKNTDALIKLKQSGVSDVIIQVIMGVIPR